jgi:NAD(P)-dependent dehydrogenase (short-subunit alcohol dehydrogenase family)
MRAVAELKSRSRSTAIEFLQSDFSSLADVRHLASAVLERTAQIDILINNAGSIFAQRALSKDGYELTFAVNHLAPFLLTNLLLSALKSSGTARIVTTSSVAHRSATLNFDDLQSAGKYSPMGAYGRSKLANILFTRALAKRLAGTAVTANCLHPGLVRTNIARDMPAIGRALFNLFARFARSPEKGAQTIIYLASSPQVQGASGGYYVDCRLMPISPAAHDDTAAERLWQVSEKLVGLASS